MNNPNDTLSAAVYDSNSTKAEATARRLRALGHGLSTCTSTRPLLYRHIRQQSPDLVVIGKGPRDHAAVGVVRSVVEIERLPILLVVDAFGDASEELKSHPAVSVVHRMASETELRMRIGEARTRCGAHEEHLHRIDRLKARVEHEPMIANAKIRLMDQFGLSEEEAYVTLRTSSQHRRMRLEEVAQLVLSDGVRVVSDLVDEQHCSPRNPRAVRR